MEIIITITDKRVTIGHKRNGNNFETSKTYNVEGVPSFPAEETHVNAKAFTGNPAGVLQLSNLPKEIADTLEVGAEYKLNLVPVETE